MSKLQKTSTLLINEHDSMDRVTLHITSSPLEDNHAHKKRVRSLKSSKYVAFFVLRIMRALLPMLQSLS
jgi:hypothetical protein